jgi:curli biogenesis system outer membrane secretion channel CsgG
MARSHHAVGRTAGKGRRAACLSLLVLGLSGCVRLHQARLGAGEEPTLIGPAVRDNRTPMDASLACLAGDIAGARKRPLVIAVGDVRDYTGKYSVNEGNAITQGGALMVSSALGKLGGAVGLAERFDPTIAERELGYTDRRQLGDGEIHDVAGSAGAGHVPWLPYYGGSIAASDYYIVGGITELNYDIRSGGLDTEVSQLGPKARIFTQGVAIDLRIVDTRSLLVKGVRGHITFTRYSTSPFTPCHMSWSRCGNCTGAPGWISIAWARLSWTVSHHGPSASSTSVRISGCMTKSRI